MLRQLLCLALILGLATAVGAEPRTDIVGGDQYITGSGPSPSIAGERDVFATAPAVTLKGSAAGDVHAFGFDVEVEADAGADVYAAGGAVTIRGRVGEDLSVSGISVRTAQSARTQGNARLAGATITIDGPVDGSLVAAGAEIILNAPIGGDVRLASPLISFGPEAVIGGSLVYAATEEITVPERVIPSDRVTFERVDPNDMFEEFRDTWEMTEYPAFPTFRAMLGGFVIILAFFLVVGALFLSFLPERVEQLRETIATRPGMTFLSGLIGLSVLFGLIPIAAMTVVGIPFVPIMVLAVFVAWTLAYILGAYAVAMQLRGAFGATEPPTMAARLVALALAVVAIAVLNFIPFIGWMVNFTLVLLGVGAITTAIFIAMTGGEPEVIEEG